jgi:hypothetical protein
MKLLTKSIISKLPPLESTDGKDPRKIKIPCKFILPGTQWRWWPFEFDGDDTFFGFVEEYEKELGYFTLEQLHQKRGPFRSQVERDKFFSSCKLSDLLGNEAVKRYDENLGKLNFPES